MNTTPLNTAARIAPRVFLGIGLLAITAIVLVMRFRPATVQDWRGQLPPPPDASHLPAAYTSAVSAALASIHEGTAPLEGLAELAHLYHANDFLPEAAICWTTLHLQDPRNPRWPYYLAATYQELGDENAAERFFALSAGQAPGYPRTWLRLADYYFKSGQLIAAADAYQRRLELVPGDRYARLGLARISARSPESTDTVEALRELVADAPDFAPALSFLAAELEVAGQTTAALTMRQRADAAPRFAEADDPWLRELRTHSYDAKQLVLWGNYAMKSRRRDRASSYFRQAIERSPESSEAFQFLGKLHADAGQLTEAIQVLTDGVRLADARDAMFVTLAESHLGRQQITEALQVANDGLQRFPDSGVMLNLRGRVRAILGETALAMADFEAALVAMPHYAEPALNLAIVHLESEDRSAAERALQTALDRQPQFPRVQIILAELAMADADLMGALDRLQSVYQQTPAMPEVRAALTRWFYLALQDRLAAGDRLHAEQLVRQGSLLLPEIQADLARSLADGVATPAAP